MDSPTFPSTPPAFPFPASFRRLVACLLSLLFAAGVLHAQTPPPETFSRTVTNGTETVTVNFSLHPIRSTNFAVLVQDAAGVFNPFTADVPRTYLGTVTGRPGALAVGFLKANGTLLYRVGFENGVEWSSTGGAPETRGSTNWSPLMPTTLVGPGGAGSTVYAAETGAEATYQEYLACGSDVGATVDMIEYSILSANYIYLRDAAILHRVGKVVIRAVQAQDPYEADGGDTGKLLPRVRTLWTSTLPVGTTHDIALVARPGANGGLAYVGVIGTSSRYSANQATANGDFSVVWRHEAGHNWGSSHYEGGGKPEGPTIMSDNGLSRFSSSELAKIIAHRNTKFGILDNLGAYSFPLPPRANMDRAGVVRGGNVLIDVLENDSDSNGDAISLLSFDATSALGVTLVRSTGTGPGGRDQILYTAPSGFTEGADTFSYRIQDATGNTATGYVAVGPAADLIKPVDHWKLDETAGISAVNSIRSLNGTHQNGTLVNQPGATSVTRRGAYYDGTNDRTSIEAPNYNTNKLTFTAWVKRNGNQINGAPVIFTRAGSSIAGLYFGSANELRYIWDGAGNTFTPSPALTVPDNTWCLVSLSVSPTGATIHLRTPTGIQSATDSRSLAAEAFNSTIYLARDTGGSTRFYKGWLDDVRAYNQTLTAAHIESLYQQAVNPPVLTLTSPAASASVSPLDLTLTASASASADLRSAMDFVEGDTVLGSSELPPYAITLPSYAPGTHSVSARATYGDWGYVVESPTVTFTAQVPPPPKVSVGTAGAPSRTGLIPGNFVIRRDHAIGSITVPFTITGTAIPDTDYAALPSSVTLPDGALSANVTVTPLASGSAENRTVILTLDSGSDYTLQAPTSATFTLDTHITSIATGAWNAGTTWTSGNPAPTTGTQGTGDDYAIATHTVTSNDTNSNNQAFIAKSLRVQNGGILDLARLHGATNQNVSYNLPPLTLENGATVRFRASLGSSTHSTSAAIKNSGATTLLINGGSYANQANLSGQISGNGTLAVLSDTNGGSVTAGYRQVSVNSANNPYTGSWTVTHTGGGDESGVLRAGAANALGSGIVTLSTRGILLNETVNGLNSLSGVIMTGDNSLLKLTQPWNQPNATLALEGGSPVVSLGNATSFIGSLSGRTGFIQGSGSSSVLSVKQTTDADFYGNLGTNLKLTKTGPAKLRLMGSIEPTLALTLSEGSLGFGNPATLASLTQSAGDLLFDLPSSTAARLTLSGNYSRTGGRIVLTASTPPQLGTPYTLVAYHGTLSSQPVFSFIDHTGANLVATIQYGTGTNSSITVTFSPAPVQYELTVGATPVEGGTTGGGGTYDENTLRAITAVPASGWEFTGWTGGGVTDPGNASTTVLIDGAKTVTASFARIDPFVSWVAGYPSLQGEAADPGADPDGDGVPNRAEMLLGLDPTNPSSKLSLAIVTMGESTLTLSINRVITTGTFTLQAADSPAGPWDDTPVVITADGDDHEIEAPRIGDRRFFRLQYRTP